MGWDDSPLFKRRLSKCLMHYNEKRHVYTHKAFSVPVRVRPPRVRQNNSVLSQSDDTFPTHLFFFKPQTSTQYLLFFLPSLLSTPEYPIIPSAAQWAVWMCLNSYVTSFSWVASCSSPLRNLPATLCQSMGSLSSAFLRHKYDPLMEMALSLVLKVRLTQVKPFHLAAQWPFT